MKKKVRISDAAKILKVSTQTLRNWDNSGKYRSKRSKGGQRYYDLEELKRYALDIQQLGFIWATSSMPPELPSEYFCERPDRFTSRSAKMGSALLNSPESVSMDFASLLTLIASEIGDNSFVHNIGNWPDVQGVFFAYDIVKRVIVLADRGRGVKATLQHVCPAIHNDTVALHVAFTEIISGRYPEKRGNGLKVVRKIAEKERIGLSFHSGIGLVTIPKAPGSMHIAMADQNVRGTFAVIMF
ncbi:MAG: MerR family DNA-binding transcriptional regulator [Patescibacteria group bacterium]